MNKNYKLFAAVILGAAISAQAEPVNTGRGLVALPHDDGVVTVSWRLRSADPANIAFNVYRRNLYGGRKFVKLTSAPVESSTTYLDETAVPGYSYRYRVQPIADGVEQESSETAYVTALERKQAYVSIALGGNYQAKRIGFGDLNGDGVLDYVIKWPNLNSDPYHRKGYWKRSSEPYKLEAYNGTNGKLLWRYDMGWAIETGVWYSPYIVYDVDQDGYAEVYAKAGEGDPREIDGRVLEGPEYLVKIDGRTGKIVAKRDWHSREGWHNYNRSLRNILAVAYLDGKSPSLIMQRGTYELMKTSAIGKDLQQQWTWEYRNPYPKAVNNFDLRKGPGTHGLITADIDEDGRDELVLGATALDDNGKVLWETELGHPDPCFVADIDPRHPGLEVFFGIEPSRDSHGVCVASARDGRFLWFYDGKTKHVHNKGMIGDIDAIHPGMECYGGEADGSQYWLYTSDGKRLPTKGLAGLSPLAVWWDTDPQKEVIVGNRMFNFPDSTIMKLEGKVLAVTDCVGDWREEVIASLPGELRIYSSTEPITSRRPWLMDDRQYRLGVVAGSMGYYREPQLSGELFEN